ncbi:MAG: DUF58 domain-containing protein [Xanthomonadaceae bacterium]|jgi:uncharacterized protein (DUF58 family)|nr:DUF58 domain-containing protein [Xanthomonadaceae bacterium]
MNDGLKPTLAELLALRALTQRGVVARRGHHGISGPSQSNQRGRGMEYAESREYIPGDEVRHIDWRLTARSGRTHTKLFQVERERLTLLVADTAKSLYFGTRVRFKSVQAARAGAVAVWMALRTGDRIAALRGSQREPPTPPASGMRGARRVLSALAAWYSGPPADDLGLGIALERATRLARPGTRIMVLADSGSLADIPLSRWRALAAHNSVTLLILVDALEIDPPQALLPFVSDGRRMTLSLAQSGTREQWRHEFVMPVEDALESLPRLGVQVRVLATADPSNAWRSPFANKRTVGER